MVQAGLRGRLAGSRAGTQVRSPGIRGPLEAEFWGGMGLGLLRGNHGVLFSKSQRGSPAETLGSTAAKSLKFEPVSGRRFVRRWIAGALSWGGWIAETLVCFVLRGRVSLLGCSGAILDRWVRVVPGVSVV